jgi:hypothetical protein
MTTSGGEFERSERPDFFGVEPFKQTYAAGEVFLLFDEPNA